MKKLNALIILGLFFVFLAGLSGCGENVTIVATADLLGDNGQAALINTDEPDETPIIVDIVENPSKILCSLDGTKAYVIGSADDEFSVIDLMTKTSEFVDIEEHLLQTRRIWDMGLSADGSKLIVGTRPLLNYTSNIEIYDTASLELLGSFSISLNPLDPYRGRKLVVDPQKEAIYVIATALLGTVAQVRAFAFDGTVLDAGKPIDSDLLDLNNYDIAISPDGDLLLAVSTKIFPFKVTDDGLEALNPIAGKGEGDNYKYYGKTKILFTKNYNMIYVNSAGLYIPGLCNIGGSCVCLDKQKILNNDEDPFVFSLVDFVNDDLIKWIVGMLDENIEDIIDPLQLYGIADSAIEGDTCYMVIASVKSMAFDLTGLQGGKYILAIYKTLPLIGNIWIGGKVIDTYPNNIAVNPEKDSMVLSYFWKNKIDIFERNPLLRWLLTSSTQVDLNNYPWALDMASVPLPE
ncbi:MAG: hypothetical protein J7L53_12615 [Deltaproteobacteria bacterium]|nr:hypothetical protein [Deltaproteobacteria bacterium]